MTNSTRNLHQGKLKPRRLEIVSGGESKSVKFDEPHKTIEPSVKPQIMAA